MFELKSNIDFVLLIFILVTSKKLSVGTADIFDPFSPNFAFFSKPCPTQKYNHGGILD